MSPAACGCCLRVNALLLAWRLAMRAVFTGQHMAGARALRSVPRMLVGNFVALLAARRAVLRYIGMLRGLAPRWDKTRARFSRRSSAASHERRGRPLRFLALTLGGWTAATRRLAVAGDGPPPTRSAW